MAVFQKYRPAMAAFLQMMAMALTTTALSFFVGPVCGEFGFGRGSFTVYYSILTAAGTIASPFLGQAMVHWGVRVAATISAFWTAAGLMMFSFCSDLWMFYLAGAFTGFFGTACVTLCASVTVQTCYRGRAASRLTGIVMAGSGLGGMLVSFALPGLIEKLGWRWSFRAMAVCWLCLCLCSAWLLRGQRQTARPAQRQEQGMTRAEAVRSPKLYGMVFVIFLLSAASGVQQQLPAVLRSNGLDSSRVSGAMSVFTATLALGKILQGMVYGKTGPKKGGAVMVLLYIMGFALLGSRLVWPGLLALAVGMGTVTTLMPIVTRGIFGGREYASIWSIFSAVSNLGAMTAAPLFGMAFDVTGSYAGALLAAAVLLIPALGALMALFHKTGGD